MHSTFGGCPPAGASVACWPQQRQPGVEMDNFEPGVWMAVAHLAELHRHPDRRRLACRIPGRTAGRRRNRTPGWPWVPVQHRQAPDGAGGSRTAAAAAASGPEPGATGAAMLMGHQHEPGVFDAGHCRACARQAGLLDHYRWVQQEKAALRQAHGWALEASRRASVALWWSSIALLLAAIALVTR